MNPNIEYKNVTYSTNSLGQVVPYFHGKKSNDTSEYRDLTEYEKQLLDEIEELKKEIEFLKSI